jgi:phosphatidylglycerophosphate synthase
MDIGVYNLKYPVRRLLAVILPAFGNVDPNVLSWSMLPVGLLIALAYHFGAQGRSILYLVGALLIAVRMFLGTMDGLVATRYGKATPSGIMVNRLSPELCDVMYMLALVLARPEWRVPGVMALAACWMIGFAGFLGATASLPYQSVGPAGQADRLVVLQAISVLAYLGARRGWTADFPALFLWWVAIGGAITVWLRLWRTFRALGGAEPASRPT